MSWTVTRQHQWPDGDFVVEVSAGGLDYTNPGALCAKYEGEFQTFASNVAAVTAAIGIAKAWQRDSPDKEIQIAAGSTGGMTMPFSGEPLDDSVFDALLKEAAEADEALPKCGRCGEILGRETYFNEDSEWSGEKFCSENCAEQAQVYDKCRKCTGLNEDGEGEDGLCGNCADERDNEREAMNNASP